jgi:hypothetical protein
MEIIATGIVLLLAYWPITLPMLIAAIIVRIIVRKQEMKPFANGYTEQELWLQSWDNMTARWERHQAEMQRAELQQARVLSSAQQQTEQTAVVSKVFMANLSDEQLIARGWKNDEVIDGAPPFYVFQEQGGGAKQVARRGTEMYDAIRGGFR